MMLWCTIVYLNAAFESTLHEMQCSDGQYISVLRKWNGEQFACLPEIWRKYFPEACIIHIHHCNKQVSHCDFLACVAELVRMLHTVSTTCLYVCLYMYVVRMKVCLKNVYNVHFGLLLFYR